MTDLTNNTPKPALPDLPQPKLCGAEECNIIPGRQKRYEEISIKALFEAEVDPEATNAALVRRGFRKILSNYVREICDDCRACLPCRVAVDHFTPGKTQRRCLNRNSDLTVAVVTKYQGMEHVELYKKHNAARHDGADADLSMTSLFAIAENSFLRCRVMEIRQDQKLVAVGLFDQMDDGLFGTYYFYDPELSDNQRSLGTFIILQLIEHAKKQGLPYLYMGPWTDEPSKLNYKNKFGPFEVMDRDEQWRVLFPERPKTPANG